MSDDATRIADVLGDFHSSMSDSHSAAILVGQLRVLIAAVRERDEWKTLANSVIMGDDLSSHAARTLDAALAVDRKRQTAEAERDRLDEMFKHCLATGVCRIWNIASAALAEIGTEDVHK